MCNGRFRRFADWAALAKHEKLQSGRYSVMEGTLMAWVFARTRWNGRTLKISPKALEWLRALVRFAAVGAGAIATALH